MSITSRFATLYFWNLYHSQCPLTWNSHTSMSTAHYFVLKPWWCVSLIDFEGTDPIRILLLSPVWCQYSSFEIHFSHASLWAKISTLWPDWPYAKWGSASDSEVINFVVLTLSPSCLYSFSRICFLVLFISLLYKWTMITGSVPSSFLSSPDTAGQATQPSATQIST